MEGQGRSQARRWSRWSLLHRLPKSDLVWALGAASAHLAFFLVVLSANGWTADPLLEIHDGQYYVSHLRDPFLQGDLGFFDNVPYRAVRIGYVLLALPFRWIRVVPALVFVNVLAIALGTIAIRWIARQHEASATLTSFVWILNPGALVATALLLPDTVAWTAILFSVLAMSRRRWMLASLLGLIAVMTKEASLVAIGGAGLVVALSKRELRALLPAAGAATWQISYLWALTNRFGPTAHATYLDWPFVGWVESFQHWLTGARPISALIGPVMMLGAIWVIVRLARNWPNMYLGAAAGQALLMVIIGALTLTPMSASTRLAGLFWPVLFATSRSGEDHAQIVD